MYRTSSTLIIHVIKKIWKMYLSSFPAKILTRFKGICINKQILLNKGLKKNSEICKFKELKSNSNKIKPRWRFVHKRKSRMRSQRTVYWLTLGSESESPTKEETRQIRSGGRSWTLFMISFPRYWFQREIPPMDSIKEKWKLTIKPPKYPEG